MKPSSLFYQIRQGIRNIGRNKMFSIASIATMTACIFLFGLLFSIIMNVDSVRRSLEEKVGVTVFFEEGTTDERMAAIGDEIRAIDHVTEATFTSADEAWENYKAEHFADNPQLAEGFKENPLANSASFTILVDKIDNQQQVVNEIGKIEGVRQINQSSAAAKNLKGFNKIFSYISAAVIAILLIVSIILIMNTITVGITVRKEEIVLMKLIGATDSFVRGPFIIEGLLLGLIGSAIPLGILYAVYNLLISRLLARFGFLNSMGGVLLNVNQVFAVLLPLGVLLGIGIGVAGARITVKRHLDV